MRKAGGLDHKLKRHTSQRIAEAALALFNRFGEPSVTASFIAADLGISLGNLQYHYASKDKIVEDLFASFEHAIGPTLAVPRGRPADPEDLWLFLHLTFETIFKYRFLYRDLNELLSRHRVIETQFKELLGLQVQTAAGLLRGLVQTGAMSLPEVDCTALAGNMTIIATYWLSYDFVLHPRRKPDSETLTQGIAAVLSLASPYLEPAARALFDHLSEQYLKTGGNGHDRETCKMGELSRQKRSL